MDLYPSPQKLSSIHNGSPPEEPGRIAAIKRRQQAARAKVVEGWSRFAPSENQFDDVLSNIDHEQLIDRLRVISQRPFQNTRKFLDVFVSCQPHVTYEIEAFT